MPDIIDYEQQDEDELEKAIKELKKRFDTVHIFVTRDHGEQGTMSLARGFGNFYARFGQVMQWITSNATAGQSIRDDDDT